MAIWGLKYANVSTFIQNVSKFCSLAVLRGGFVKLHNLVHGLAGLTPLVHLLAVPIDHQVGAVPSDGLDLAIGASRFQKIDGRVLAKAAALVKCGRRK